MRPRAAASATSLAAIVPLKESGATSTGDCARPSESLSCRRVGRAISDDMVVSGRRGVILEVAGREVRISNPSKVFFPEPGLTKLDLVNYYLECADAVIRHLRERPTTLNGGERWTGILLPEARAEMPRVLTTATVRSRAVDPHASSSYLTLHT